MTPNPIINAAMRYTARDHSKGVGDLEKCIVLDAA
jgi:hypothetical protein